MRCSSLLISECERRPDDANENPARRGAKRQATIKALSPVTLKNYSPCAATEGKVWPPAWVTTSLDEPGTAQPEGMWYANPQRATLARAENAYALGYDEEHRTGKAYIHLLDGGIADNLGRWMNSFGRSPPSLPSA